MNKTEIAQFVQMSMQDLHIADSEIEVSNVTALQTQIKAKDQYGAPHYFIVQVKEML